MHGPCSISPRSAASHVASRVAAADALPPLRLSRLRVALAAWLRPLRLLIPSLERVQCHGCGWRGLWR